MSQTPDTLQVKLRIVFSGFLMGGADVIPGVSGGTVALILGIYSKLVTAISRVDREFFSHLLNRRFREAADHIELQFLIFLGVGIGAGIVSLAGLMHYLLLEQHTRTLAVFFGLIVASSWLVSRIVTKWNLEQIVAIIVGSLFAFWLVGLPLFQNPPNHFGYLFFCGMIAICAMILPGISGAFILLLLGKYAEITGMLKGLVHGEISGEIILSIITFVAGCLVGLLGFSKILKTLLAKKEATTMAVLCGFMIGSLRKLWPFQQDLTPEIHELKHKVFENIPFAEAMKSSELIPVILLILFSAAAVLLLERLASGVPKAQKLENENE